MPTAPAVGTTVPFFLSSMHDLLTPDEDKTAASQGWSLEYVFDMTAQKWVTAITGAPNAHAAQLTVYALAKQGNALAIKALRLLVKGPKK